MRSSRWQALGNRYVVVEPEAGGLDAEAARELSVDADGVIEVVDASPDRVEIRIWNPDGSTAEMSGNGTRIAAAWLAARTGAHRIDVVVGARTVRTAIRDDGVVEQDLGPVVVAAEETLDGLTFVPVSVGNPHAVVLGDPATIESVGPVLERHPRFPERTNVQVARVERAGEVTARVWERGVGETASSGTSAVAVAAATHETGEVIVHFPGGDLRVRLVEGRALLYGSVEPVD